MKTIMQDETAIVTDLNDRFLHRVANQNSFSFNLSKDLEQPQSMLALKRIDDFVETIKRLDSQPFMIERSLKGVSLRKSSKIGKSYYQLLYFLASIPTQYTPNKSIQVFFDLLNKLEIRNVLFSGNPLSPIWSDNSVLEGDLINCLVSHLRTHINSKSHLRSQEKYHSLIRHNLSATRRFVSKIFSVLPSALVVRIDFEYKDSSVKFQEHENHIDALIIAFNKSESIIGWWFKREYLSECGYRTHFVLFIDPKLQTSIPELISELQETWSEITKPLGVATNHFPPNSHRHSFQSRVIWPTKFCMSQFFSQLNKMLYVDQLLMLKQINGKPHISMELTTAGLNRPQISEHEPLF